MKYLMIYKYLFFCGILAVSFFNCSELHISSWNCIETEDQNCLYSGDVGLLDRKFIDMLVVLDNSDKAKKIQPVIKTGLSNLIDCMEPVDLRVGVMTSSESAMMGDLLSLEMEGQVSHNKILKSSTPKYAKFFKDTISLDTGCEYPPYCSSGKKIKPLTAMQSFMQKENQKQSFLRDYSSLFVVVMVTSSDEKGANAELVLENVYGDYTADRFMAVTVTDLGQKKNCLYSSQDRATDNLNFIGKVSSTYGILAAIPEVAIAGSLLNLVTSSSQKEKVTPQTNQVIQFAIQSGGKFFDICKASFGREIAQDIFQKVNIERQIPDQCKRTTDTAENKKGKSID